MSAVGSSSAMAKKTSLPKQAPPARMGRPKSEEGPRRQILALRGRDAYKAWLTRFAEVQRSDVSDLVDDALAAYAKSKGFDVPPRR